jgi:hypothetical protein
MLREIVMAELLDYASPPPVRPPKRWLGWILGMASFALSLLVAVAAFSQAYAMRNYSGCGFGYGALEGFFWYSDPLIEAFAVAGWVLCAKRGAGSALCRVGVGVVVLIWIGSWVSLP